MAGDYNPVFLPGEEIPLTASGNIAAGDLVVVSGSGTVAKASTLAAPFVVGVAAQDAVANTRLTVYARGPVHESVADGTVTAGDQVGSTNTANRQVKTVAVSNVDLGGTFTQPATNNALNAGLNAVRGVLGVALTTAADNTKVRWMSF